MVLFPKATMPYDQKIIVEKIPPAYNYSQFSQTVKTNGLI